MVAAPLEAAALDPGPVITDGCEISHADLHVDDRLPDQVWDGGGSDVVDSRGLVAEGLSEPLAEDVELLGPRRVVGAIASLATKGSSQEVRHPLLPPHGLPRPYS